MTMKKTSKQARNIEALKTEKDFNIIEIYHYKIVSYSLENTPYLRLTVFKDSKPEPIADYQYTNEESLQRTINWFKTEAEEMHQQRVDRQRQAERLKNEIRLNSTLYAKSHGQIFFYLVRGIKGCKLKLQQIGVEVWLKSDTDFIGWAVPNYRTYISIPFEATISKRGVIRTENGQAHLYDKSIAHQFFCYFR